MPRMTIREVYDAIEKNGYQWTTGEFIVRDMTKEGQPAIAACAMGQAALNLDVDVTDLREALPYGISGNIEEFNDNEAQEYADVVAYAKDIMEAHFDEEIFV